MLAVAAALLVALLAVIAVLLWWSHPGEPTPFLDPGGRALSGSISEKIRVRINGRA